MPSSTLTSKGQTTIPLAVREHLKLRSGDQIDFVVQPDGTVVIRPATKHVSHLKGLLHRNGMKPVSIKTMDGAIRNRFSKVR